MQIWSRGKTVCFDIRSTVVIQSYHRQVVVTDRTKTAFLLEKVCLTLLHDSFMFLGSVCHHVQASRRGLSVGLVVTRVVRSGKPNYVFEKHKRRWVKLNSSIRIMHIYTCLPFSSAYWQRSECSDAIQCGHSSSRSSIRSTRS